MTEPMISAFWSRTLVRSSSMYACTFFFCVSVPGDFATGLWVAGAFGVTCARAAGLVAKSMKSGSHTAIRFFILNPPIRVTSLQRNRRGAVKNQNSLQQTWESQCGQVTGTLSLHHIRKVPWSRAIAFKNQLIVFIYLDAQSNDQTSRTFRLVIAQVKFEGGQVVVRGAPVFAGFRDINRAIGD